jgi:hypothetical protein
MLVRLRECAPTEEGGLTSVCKPPSFFDYENEVPGLGQGIDIGFHPNNPGEAQYDVIPDMPLDMNGDGVDDLLMVVLDAPPQSGNNFNGWNKHFEVLFSGRDRVEAVSANGMMLPTDLRNAPEIYNVFDYDADGRDDLLMEAAMDTGTYKVLTYKGAGFEVVDLGISSSTRPIQSNNISPVHRSYIVDADGDGVRDILKCSAVSTGLTWPPPGPWTWTLVHVPDMTERPVDFDGLCFPHYIAADVAGGGRQSLIIQNLHNTPSGTPTSLSNPTGLQESEDTYLSLSFENAERGNQGPVGVSIVRTHVPASRSRGDNFPLDVNGDGFTDILHYSRSGDLITCFGTGNGRDPFYCREQANYVEGAPIVEGKPNRLLTPSGTRYAIGPVIDVNGDGREDVLVAGYGQTTWRVPRSLVCRYPSARCGPASSRARS